MSSNNPASALDTAMETPRVTSLVNADEEIRLLPFIDVGKTGIVYELGEHRAIKVPKVLFYINEKNKWTEDYDVWGSIQGLENEKSAFRRLGHHASIIEWYDLRLEGIEMKYMANSTLRNYRWTHDVSHDQLLSWFLDIARALAYAHSRNVIVFDVAATNVLIDDDLSAKLCDFGDAIVLPLEMNIATTMRQRGSVYADIFQFGLLMNEAVTRVRPRFHIADVQTEGDTAEELDTWFCWPERRQLPYVVGDDFGDVMLECWTGGFKNMEAIVDALRTILRQEGHGETFTLPLRIPSRS